MFIQVSDTPEQSLLNVVWGFIVGVVEGRSGQGGKVGLDEIEPRAVGGQPVKEDSIRMCLCPACHRLCLVSAEVIQNQMDATLRPVGQHHFLEKGAAVDTLLAGGSTPERLSCLRTERCEELQGPRLSSVSVGPMRRAPSPPWSPSRHGLEWPQLVETNDRTIGGRVPIQTNYGVFLRRSPDPYSGTRFGP